MGKGYLPGADRGNCDTCPHTSLSISMGYEAPALKATDRYISHGKIHEIGTLNSYFPLLKTWQRVKMVLNNRVCCLSRDMTDEVPEVCTQSRNSSAGWPPEHEWFGRFVPRVEMVWQACIQSRNGLGGLSREQERFAQISLT